MPQLEQIFVVGEWCRLEDAVAGSRYDLCVDCGQEVALSPSSQEILGQGASPLCMRCYRRREPPGRPIVTSAHRREIARELGRPVAEKELEAWIDQILGE